MTSIFLDTVGLLALWDAADQWHAAASEAYRQVALMRRSFVTTTFVLLECAKAAARRTYRSEVCMLRRTLEKRSELLVPTGDDWIKAWESYERGEAGQAGLVDHVSFIAMRQLGITEAFTNDRHFQAAGFTVLF